MNTEQALLYSALSGFIPSGNSAPTKQQLISHFREGLEQYKLAKIDESKFALHSTFSTTKKSDRSRKLNLDTLSPINIRNFALNKTHKNSYLKGKIILEPMKLTAVIVLLEDSNGDIAQVAIYNHPYAAIYKERFKAGTTIIIKEPFFKLFADGWPGIRVDNILDIEIEEEQLYTAETNCDKLKQYGSAFFKDKKFTKAIDCYDRILKQNPADITML